MTTELVLLLAIFAFVILGVFVGGNSTPSAVFKIGGPHLAARIEEQIATGRNFPVHPDRSPNSYFQPPTQAPETGF